MDEIPRSVRAKRLEAKALIVGYAMSRLDRSYLMSRSCESWKAAYLEVGRILNVSVASIKNLRDEFDPLHANTRRGWLSRPMRPNRLRIAEELGDISDDALKELVSRVLSREDDSIAEAVDSLANVTKVAANVAERLLTGRRAEEYFLQNSHTILGVDPAVLVDARHDATGYDFGLRNEPQKAIEVKGIKGLDGNILFTDREWREAEIRRKHYIVVVVGSLASTPSAKVIVNPYGLIDIRRHYESRVVVSWRSWVSVA